MKKLAYIILGIAIAVGGTAFAQSIPSQSPFYYSGSNITQIIPSAPFQLSGQSTGCAQFNSSGVLTSTGILCGSGGGGSTFGTTSINATYPLNWNTTTATMSSVATSSLNLTVGSFLSPNISQWTNNVGYLTSLAGAASSTLLGDNNTFSGTDLFTNAASNFAGTWQNHSPSYFQIAGSYLTSAITGLSDTYHTALTSAVQTLATSSPDTNLGMTIVSSGTQHLFTPYWIGTLADNRIASAATWNAKQAAITATWPQILTGSTLSFGGISTSSAASIGSLPYWTGVNTLGNVATGTVTCTGNASCGAGSYVLGNPLTINGTGGAGSVTSITAGTGLLGGTITTSGTLSLASYIATSSSETSTYIPFWTSTAGTPATLSGGTSNLTWNGTKLSTTYASTTAITSSASSTFGGVNITAGGLSIATLASGVLHSVSGVITSSLVNLASEVTGVLGLSNGGTNASSFTTSGNALYYNGTSLATAPLTSAITIPYATTTSISSSATSTFAGLALSSGSLKFADGTYQTTAAAASTNYWTLNGNNIYNNNNGGLGKVGIGTSSPLATLDVAGALSQSAPLFSVSQVAAAYATSTALIIDSNSNVGIASSSPWGKVGIGTGTASTSVTVAEYKYGAGSNQATSTAATIDCRTSNQQHWRMGAAATTLTLSGGVPGTKCIVVVENPNGTAGSLTWAAASGYLLLWAGGTVPTQTVTANKQDVWSFLVTSASSTVDFIGAATLNI